MSKSSRGLPKDFQLNVSTSPIDLGDYLDEQPSKTPVASVDTNSAIEPDATTARNSVKGRFGEPLVAGSIGSLALPAPTPEVPIARTGGPPRKQLNMTPETLRMVDELLIHIRNHSAERDVRASELFHALVFAVHDVRPFLDLSRVPMRGRWGSTTAANLPIALKEAFQDAIARARMR